MIWLWHMIRNATPRIGVCMAGVLGLLGMPVFATAPAKGATIGSSLASAANGSVCSFQSFEPETRVCTVGQRDLTVGHTAPDGLVAPIDGIVVRWSVVSGAAPPGTGPVKLALRATHGPGYLEKGLPVDLPTSPPGTRHTYAEQMPVTAGQPLGVKIWVSNRSTQEAGAPIAFRETGIGRVQTWTDEPWESISDDEVGVELLFNAEIEPDLDDDGFGDFTQDCFPNHPGDQHLCGLDFVQPTIRARALARQGFLRSGVIRVKVASDEAGIAKADGRLEIRGHRKRFLALPKVQMAVSPGNQVTLRLRVPKRARRAANGAARKGKKIVAKARVRVADLSGNVRQAAVHVRPR